ncbi:Lrp/AsnC family transcriptional regulator [Sphingomonas sp.]|uniref:Lrp/AsnC family transcriptional regulator n=1 Tax=Sphingomonas sp. TaxID=28214 RepID=UPI00286A5792|nr:Lrp/AsnC family transcriptional regulator [Sphingomonas sp.]
MKKLDRLDRRLLELVQRDASLTNDQLSGRIGLSPSAIHRRLRKLQASGAIEGRFALVDPAKVGSGALYAVGLEVERERPELVQPLRAWLRDEAAVQQAYYVTGTSDYLLLISAPDIAAFDQLMSRMMQQNPNVRRFTTNVVMMAIKRGLFVPVE